MESPGANPEISDGETSISQPDASMPSKSTTVTDTSPSSTVFPSFLKVIICDLELPTSIPMNSCDVPESPERFPKYDSSTLTSSCKLSVTTLPLLSPETETVSTKEL